jgi:hypothetical protein
VRPTCFSRNVHRTTTSILARKISVRVYLRLLQPLGITECQSHVLHSTQTAGAPDPPAQARNHFKELIRASRMFALPCKTAN